MQTHASGRLQPALLAAAIVIASAVPAFSQAIFDVSFGEPHSHPFDVLHTAIDVRFDEGRREVIGSVAHTIRSLNPRLLSFRLDAAPEMKIASVTIGKAPAVFRHDGEKLEIDLPRPWSYGDSFTVAIDYRVSPKSGLYFVAPDSLAPDRRRQIWTQGEAEEHHHWVPIYDYPNDRATTEMRATLRDDWQFLSNGRLVSRAKNGDGTATWHYVMDQPHASYLIMLAAGEYLVTHDNVDGRVPLEYWTYTEMPDRVATTFGRTPDMIRYFERMLGVPYPWNKYAQVVVDEYMYGGMENTTATVLNDYVLVDRRALLDYNPDGVIAHEVAHQWFGDLVTCRSWGHLWIQESFATYLSTCYRGFHYGEEARQNEVQNAGETALNADRFAGRDPIALGRGITANLYQRGSRVLNMLNILVGEELFWRSCRHFLEKHRLGLVETHDLQNAFEDVTGLELDWFFDQWVYGAGAPELAVSYEYTGDSVHLRVAQIQKIDSLTGLFRLQVPVEIHTERGVTVDTVWVSGKEDVISIAAPARPRFVVFDAGDAILKKVRFTRSEQELIAQMAGAPRMIDRVNAAVDLAAADSTLITSTTRPVALRDAYRRERSWYVRSAILDAVATFRSGIDDLVPLALADSQSDIREKGAELAFRIADRDRRLALLRPLLHDSSTGVTMAAIRALSLADPVGLEPHLARMKGVRGRREHLAQTWLEAVENGRYRSFADDVADYAGPGFNRSTRTQAFRTLERIDTTTAEVRIAIERGLRDSARSVRAAAIDAAGTRLDEPMRAYLTRLLPEMTKEDRESVEALLKNGSAGSKKM